jgi:hypothetical protein
MPKNLTEFEQAKSQKQLSLAGEFLVLVFQNKRWWLLPILFVFAVMGALAMFASTGAAPFVYTMF